MGTTSNRRTRVGSVVGVAALALATAASLVLGAAGTASAYDPTHTAFKGAVDRGDPGMGQTDGPVLTLETVGGQVVAGGNFTSTRPAGAAAGSGETGQGYLAAFDAVTGQPSDRYSADLSFECTGERCPNVEDPAVRATVVSPDGSTLWVGGDFNRVDGQVTNYIAKFDTATGAYLGTVGRNFNQGKGTDGPVHSLALSPDGDTLYAGGTFARAGDKARRFVAAFDLGTNQVVESFAPTIEEKLWDNENLRVIALGVSGNGDNVLIGGTFGRSNKRAVQGFTAVSAATGKNLQGRWKEPYLRGNRTWATAIETGRDGTIFVGARSDSRGKDLSRTEGVYRLDDSTGRVIWYANCYGDTYAIQPFGNDVYVGSHAHNCERAGGMPEQRPRIRLAVHALNRATGKVRPYFVLTSGQTEKTRFLSRAFTIDPQARQLVMGGGYARVNATNQANLVRFARGSAAPSRAAYPRASTCQRCNAVQVRFTTGFDRDDIDLRYEVFRTRGGKETRIRTIRRQSFFYTRSTVSFKDTKTRRGQRVSYRVRVSDPAGNRLMSVRTPVITAGRP